MLCCTVTNQSIVCIAPVHDCDACSDMLTYKHVLSYIFKSIEILEKSFALVVRVHLFYGYKRKDK